MARNTMRSVMEGTTFSAPITATWTRGSEVTIRPVPSLVTSTIVPVSVTAKVARVIVIAGRREFLPWPASGTRRELLGVCLHGALELGEEPRGHLPLRLVDRGRDDVRGT